MGFARFMSSMTGRLIRILGGLAMILVGLVSLQGVWGIILAIVGAVVLEAGAFNFCIFAPLFGGPFWARDIK